MDYIRRIRDLREDRDLTQKEVAAYLHCDGNAISRELSRMQEDGLIELFRSTFKLPDPERLANEM